MKARAESRKRARPAKATRPKLKAPQHAAGRVAAAMPAIILVKPQLGENIGFAARAMANFGLTDLRLVAPRDGWPNDKARAAAAGAAALVDQATVYASVAEAIGGLNFVLASTARPREMVKPVLSAESAAAELRRRGAGAERTGVLFGPERSGLDNDTIALADAILTAPVNPDFASLSLPQAVLLFGYEWFKANAAALRRTRGRGVVRPRHTPGGQGRTFGLVRASGRGARPRGFSLSGGKTPLDGEGYPQYVSPHERDGAGRAHLARYRGCARGRTGRPRPETVIVPPRFSYCDWFSRCLASGGEGERGS